MALKPALDAGNDLTLDYRNILQKQYKKKELYSIAFSVGWSQPSLVPLTLHLLHLRPPLPPRLHQHQACLSR